VKTSTQLKAKARNLSAKTNIPPHIIQRNYFLERFLERLSMSRYQDSIVLKGGVLITSLLGIEARATVDLDATIQVRTLTVDEISSIIDEVLCVNIDDSVVFTFTGIEETRVEAEYPGFRVTLNVTLDKLYDTVKIDFTAGDIITPKPVEYGYRLMFEDREIRVLAYNLETVLAEKFTTLLSFDVANSRMKDFYDIYMLVVWKDNPVDPDVFAKAVNNTAKQRSLNRLIPQAAHIVETIAGNATMIEFWKRYQTANKYATGITFADVISSLCLLVKWCGCE
jgi:predicted nucleotidyltransferase component of viral defense system